MLHFNINLELQPDFSAKTKDSVDRLTITSCAIRIYSEDLMWSAFEEETFNAENNNDWGLGQMDIEVGFAGYTGASYPKVYTKCFALRTDNGLRIKPMKSSNRPSQSKISQRGETVIGIRYYFRSEKEIEWLKSSKRIRFECFFALKNKKNTYALMCQMKRDGDEWKAEIANTYRPSYVKNIGNLID